MACGAAGGLIDIFLVGTPGKSVSKNSALGNWTDSQANIAVKRFAKISGWTPDSGQQDNVASAIRFLERKYKVNYDQRYNSDVNNLFNMSTQNHHMLSLSHSPDTVGLFFSILNQLTYTSSFIADGNLITIKTETYELQGGNFIAKIFCGIANWFGHVMSDIAGSNHAEGRGSGIVMPFYELFGLCKFGKFRVDEDRQDLAVIATRAFQEGYDFRFGMAQTVPVIITDLSIRLIWSLRRYFQYEKPIKECIPSAEHDDLRIMILFGMGTLCIMDGADAAIRSGGNFLHFFERMNLIAWFRFSILVLKEVLIRIGIRDSLQASIDAYKRINETLLVYLKELEKIDIALFRKETEEYNRAVRMFLSAKSDRELNSMLLATFEKMGIQKPWEGDFDQHMANKNGTLIFR